MLSKKHIKKLVESVTISYKNTINTISTISTINTLNTLNTINIMNNEDKMNIIITRNKKDTKIQ